MPKSWGSCLGRSGALDAKISPMRNREAHVRLAIEVDSEPISGSVSIGSGPPRVFRGWIELVERLEAVRSGRPEIALVQHPETVSEKSLGWAPGAKAQRL